VNEPGTIFKYASGEKVCEFDEIISHGHQARVASVFLPLTEPARDYDCYKTGGILIEEVWGNQINRVLETPPDGESWEDIKFVRRGSERFVL
jgi:hypothetical protein